MSRFDKMHRTAPGSHFGGGHVENRVLETEPYRPMRDAVGTGLALVAFCAACWFFAVVTG